MIGKIIRTIFNLTLIAIAVLLVVGIPPQNASAVNGLDKTCFNKFGLDQYNNYQYNKYDHTITLTWDTSNGLLENGDQLELRIDGLLNNDPLLATSAVNDDKLTFIIDLDEKDGVLGLNYDGFGVVAVAAIQELNEKVESQAKQLAEQEKINAELIKRLEALESGR